MKEVEDSSLYIPTLQWVYTTLSGSNNQDYSCTYPSRIEHAGTVEKCSDKDRERDQGQPEARALPKKVEKEVKKTRGASHPKKFEARALSGHHKYYIPLLFVRLAQKVPSLFFFFPLTDSRIVSHSPFACKWQNRFWDNKLVITYFPSNTSGTSNIRIPRSSPELPRTPCMRDVCHVRGLGPSHTSKQNVLSLILLILSAKLTNQKKGICRHYILYPLQLGPLFPNNAQTLRPKTNLEPN